MDKVYLFFLTFFYVGKIDYAPGTVTSLITAILWFYFIPHNYIFQLCLIFILLVVSLFLCYQYSLKNSDKDPSFIVIDEVVGMSIALFMIPQKIILYSMAFVIFRFLDITKPLFISYSEKVNNGVGIVLDDVISGILTVLMLNLYYII